MQLEFLITNRLSKASHANYKCDYTEANIYTDTVCFYIKFCYKPIYTLCFCTKL